MGNIKKLPDSIKKLFWEYDPERIDLTEHKDFIIKRILQVGDLNSIRWLIKTYGKENLKKWLLGHKGRGLETRKIRFWQNILDIPEATVTEWLKEPSRKIWEKRKK